MGFDRLTGPVEHRPSFQIVLGHTERLLDVPQVVVLADHFGRGHHVEAFLT